MPTDKFVTFTPEKGLYLVEGENRICNFDVQVLSRLAVCTDGVSEDYVRVELTFQDSGESGIYDIPLSNLETFDWFGLDKRCLLDPHRSKARAHLAYIVRSALVNAPVESKCVLSQSGYHTINSVPTILLGDRHFVPASKELEIEVEIDPVNKLVTDADCSEDKAAKKAIKAARLCPSGIIILVFLLFNLMRSAYKLAGVDHNPILYICGSSGIMKTSFATYFLQILDIDKGVEEPAQFSNASMPAIATLLCQGMGTFILDDYFLSPVGKIAQKQEELLNEVIRFVADGSPRIIKNGKKVLTEQQTRGLLLTGEKDIFSNPSTIARILTVDFDTPLDRAKLNKFQQQPYIVPTFVSYFLQWFIDDYDGITRRLREQLTKLRSKNTLKVHGKLENAFFCLVSAHGILMDYLEEKGFCEPKNAKTMHNDFIDYISDLVKAQNKRVNRSAASERSYVQIIYDLYEKDKWKLGENSGDVLKKGRDGFVKKGILYLRSDKMLQRIQKIKPSANFREIKRDLDAKQALKHHNVNKTVNIDGARYYAINLKKLRTRN
jgi:hypothetical protein